MTNPHTPRLFAMGEQVARNLWTRRLGSGELEGLKFRARLVGEGFDFGRYSEALLVRDIPPHAFMLEHPRPMTTPELLPLVDENLEPKLVDDAEADFFFSADPIVFLDISDGQAVRGLVVSFELEESTVEVPFGYWPTPGPLPVTSDRPASITWLLSREDAIERGRRAMAAFDLDRHAFPGFDPSLVRR